MKIYFLKKPLSLYILQYFFIRMSYLIACTYLLQLIQGINIAKAINITTKDYELNYDPNMVQCRQGDVTKIIIPHEVKFWQRDWGKLNDIQGAHYGTK